MKKNKILSFVLIASLIATMIFPINANKEVKAEGDTHTLSNPTTDSAGNTIWDCIYFGNYYQNDTEGNTKEPIKWRVLKVDGNDAFLMADKALDTKKWNETQVGVTWENCTLRSWLNGYGSDINICGNDYSSDNFMDVAFTEEEQNAIKTSFVEIQHDPFYNSPSGNDTYDKVYLLSYTEALNTEYGFSSDIYDGATRVVQNTPYAEAKLELPSWLSPGWWLRSHGDDTYPDNWVYYGHYAVEVYSSGFVYCNGCVVDSTGETVRPVLHLDTQNTDLFSYAGTVSSDGTVVEVTTQGQETTTATVDTTTESVETTTNISIDDEWNTATDTWTTDGTWNIWAGNGGTAQYKGNDTLDDYYVNTTNGAGAWSVQTSTIITGLTAGTLYTYTVTIETDKEGSYVGAREEYSESSLIYKTLTSGENTITGTFTATSSDAKIFLEMGNSANTGATFHITGVEVKAYGEDDSEGIPADGVWLGWFESEGWTNYTISNVTSGYTLSNKGIGSNWYSIQTGIDNVKFKAGVDYTCAFTLTADAPKQFRVDNRTGDADLFIETTVGNWTQNNNGTYSYKYVGTYKNETSVAEYINVRISLGYFSGEENYSASSTLNCTVSDFEIVPTDEYEKDVETTTEEVTTTSSIVETTTGEAETTTVESVETTTGEAETTTVESVETTTETVETTTAELVETTTETVETTTAESVETTTETVETTTAATVETTTETVETTTAATVETTTVAVPVETTTEMGNKPASPTGLVQVEKGYFTWIPESDAVSYNFYVNDVKIGSTIVTEYAAKELFTSLGEYIIGVTSVDSTGVESEKTTITVIVEETPTEETTTVESVETTAVDETTTASVETSKTDTTTQNVTTQSPTTKVKAPGKAKIKKIKVKKKNSKKIKLSLKKIKGAKGYEVRILKKKKAKKALVKKFVKKRKVTIKSKKLKNKKKLYAKVRAYKLDANGKKVFGKWSKVKKVKIKK